MNTHIVIKICLFLRVIVMWECPDCRAIVDDCEDMCPECWYVLGVNNFMDWSEEQ